ncbi:MAG: EamA family transporter [Minisyncoccia bacterium]
MKITAFVGITLCLFFASFGQIFLKKGMDEVSQQIASQKSFFKKIDKLIKNKNLFLGYVCAILAALSWLYAIKSVPLNYALPFMALTYILVPLLSKMFLFENVPVNRWFGAVIIIIGIVISYV